MMIVLQSSCSVDRGRRACFRLRCLTRVSAVRFSARFLQFCFKMDTEKKTEKFACDICNVFMPTEAFLETHLKGKKHIQNVKRFKLREEEAERSLYISGIKSIGAAELLLADHFSKYGSVAKVIVDKNKGVYAILEFTEKQSVTKALEDGQHIVDGKEVIVRQRELKQPKAQLRPEKPRIAHNPFPSDIWKAILEAENVEAQFYILQQKLSLTENDKHIRDLVCKLLQSALEEVFHECEIQPFGSSVNGFGVPGCDMDLNFDYGTVDYQAAMEFLARDKEIDKSCLDENENCNLSKKQTLAAVASILRLCVPDCHQVKAILTARRPVVKFHHKSSEMCCDVSTGNELAVRNTEFIKYLCDTVPYFRPLVQAIRIWMKHWKLSGSAHAASGLLNNYAVTMMVIFYLYNTDEMYTLDEMRSKNPNMDPCIIENWDCSFFTDSPLKNKEKNVILPELFAGFFCFYAKFDFVNKVLCLKSGQGQNVVDLKQKEEEEHTGLEKRGFKYGSLNIRDPFELNHNVAGNVGKKHMVTVVKCLKKAAFASRMNRFMKKPAKVEKEPWGILNLFIDNPGRKSSDSSPNSSLSEDLMSITVNMKRPKKDVYGLILTILSDAFLVDILNPNMDEKMDQVFDTVEQTEAIQKRQTKESNQEAASESDQNTSRKRHHDAETPAVEKRSKIAISTPLKKEPLVFQSDLSQPSTVSCSVRYRVWEGRRKVRRQLVKPGLKDVIELESRISKLLVSESEAQNESFESVSSRGSSSSQDLKTSFGFDLTLQEKEGTPDEYLLLFKFCNIEEKTPRDQMQDFRNFVHHFQLSLPTILSKCVNKE